jgi:prephenate dehydrogenase
LGGHPIAGGEKSGAAHADADLFVGRTTVLTPTSHTRAEDFDALEQFWQSLGAFVVSMPAAEHDRALAQTSHLPHVLAAALAESVPESFFHLVGPGLRDTTRVAAGEPELWLPIFSMNRENILAAIEQFGEKLSGLHAALRDGDEAALLQLLTAAKKQRDAFDARRR